MAPPHQIIPHLTVRRATVSLSHGKASSRRAAAAWARTASRCSGR